MMSCSCRSVATEGVDVQFQGVRALVVRFESSRLLLAPQHLSLGARL
jgi:hypothetical protein